jgi:hypothetical protein
MSTTRERFWEMMRGLPMPGDKEVLMTLTSVASEWREANKHFNAGYAIERAEKAAWGDGAQLYSCLTAAIQDYNKCIETQEPCAPEALAALVKLSGALGKLHTYFSELNEVAIPRTRDKLLGELGQRLITCYENTPYAEYYLVRGVWLQGNLEGDWEPSFPQWEVQWGVETWSWSQRTVRISLPSAFELFIALGDYQGAYTVIERCPDAFTTPGLRGWKAAVQGFVRPDESPERFAEAADAFAEDIHPSDDEIKQRGSWSSINIDLWAKYFRSRSALATAVREPERAKEFVQMSAAAIHGDIHWAHPDVLRYQILVQTLAHLVGEEPSLSPEQGRERFLRETRRIGQQTYDEVVVQFLTLAGEAFEGFKTDPVQELTTGRLSKALEALARIPIIGPDVTKVVQHPISATAAESFIANAPEEAFGPVRTWIYRTLESIQDENHLRRLILRLAQASLPLYAQIRHGPIEYGKDVVVLLEVDDRRVLRMYQAKCGDITKPKWRESQHELEEMFLVPLSAIQIQNEVDLREGILICNGHVNPYVEPVMEGWFQEQKRTHGHIIKFMSLDHLARWIVNERLINDFRIALSELGLRPVI